MAWILVTSSDYLTVGLRSSFFCFCLPSFSMPPSFSLTSWDHLFAPVHISISLSHSRQAPQHTFFLVCVVTQGCILTSEDFVTLIKWNNFNFSSNNISNLIDYSLITWNITSSMVIPFLLHIQWKLSIIHFIMNDLHWSGNI